MLIGGVRSLYGAPTFVAQRGHVEIVKGGSGKIAPPTTNPLGNIKILNNA
jgi:hypothetical protein